LSHGLWHRIYYPIAWILVLRCWIHLCIICVVLRRRFPVGIFVIPLVTHLGDMTHFKANLTWIDYVDELTNILFILRGLSLKLTIGSKIQKSTIIVAHLLLRCYLYQWLWLFTYNKVIIYVKYKKKLCPILFISNTLLIYM
jgi:hypothetical protein